uniref:Uncharacterized protein n=1 Tax=Ixodes ricinus TaxID=34613 RepID=A0A6B0UYN2_IXORI
MFVQMALPCKCLFTNHTLVRPLIFVHAVVIQQAGSECKCLPTHAALVGSFTCMSSPARQQVRTLCKYLVTDVAPKRLFACVSLHVNLQGGILGKCSPADTTVEWPLSRVPSFVSDEMLYTTTGIRAKATLVHVFLLWPTLKVLPVHLAVQGRGLHAAVFDIDVVLIVPPFPLEWH